MRSILPVALLVGSGLCVFFAPSCKTATVIRAHYTTDFGCRADGTLERSVMFSVARSGEGAAATPVFDGADPSDATHCSPGERAIVGDERGLVLRPSSDYSGTYELLAIVGTEGTTASACNLDAAGVPRGGVLGGDKCIVARRKVRFVDGVEIKQNVFLSSRCAGIVCPADRTCNPTTRLCIATAENTTSETGGAENGEEVEASTPPVDGGLPDVIVEPPPVLPCVGQNPLVCPVGQVVVGARAGAAPVVAAHEGKITFVRDSVAGSQVALYDFAFPGLPLDLANPPDAVPQSVVFGFVGNAKRASIVGAFEGQSILGNGHDLEAYDTSSRGPWAPIAGSGGSSGFPHLLSDGSFYAGFVSGPNPQPETSPFARNPAGDFLKRSAAVDLQITPFVGALGVAPRFVWASPKGIVSVGQDDATAQEIRTSGLAAPARLVAFGPSDRVVAIDRDQNLLLLGNTVTPAAKTILAEVSRDIVAADGRRIYAWVGKDPNKARLLAIDKATLASPSPSMCEVAVPPGAVLAGITLDATCMYLTTGAKLTTGNTPPSFTVSRAALVP